MGWVFIRNRNGLVLSALRDVFVMTSRAEACPNIVLEAMSHGCVCISTETEPMPEFFQDSAVYYPPKNGAVLANAIQEVLLWDEAKRWKVLERAKIRASQFSWETCALKTIQELRLAVEQFHHRG